MNFPLLTYRFIEWFEEQDVKEKTLIEFGSGDSTIYFSNKFKKVITYEDDLNWLQRIKSFNLPNVEIRQFGLSFYKQDSQSFKDADFILIDNNPRANNLRLYVAEALIEKINYKNNLILDNGNWNPDAYFYLRRKYRHFEDFIGHRKSGEFTVTTLFSERI